MTVSMYKISVPIFVQFLTALSVVLDKAAAHCEAKKIDPSALLDARLFPDMFPLVRQVRAATDHAVNATARLAGAEPLAFPNTEASFAELGGRLAKAIDFVKGFKARRDRRQRRQADQDHISERSDARLHRAVAAVGKFAAEFLFPLHHGLRHPAPLRRRSRQARFHGNAGQAIAPAPARARHNEVENIRPVELEVVPEPPSDRPSRRSTTECCRSRIRHAAWRRPRGP